MIKSIYLIFFCHFYLIPGLIRGETPFVMNGWQFHEYDIPKLEKAIHKAPEYGVNFFIFSHTLFRSVEGFLNSDQNYDPEKTPQLPRLKKLYKKGPHHTKPHVRWQKDIKYLGDLASAQKIPYYLWIHEFDDLPPEYLLDGKADFDNPDLFKFIEDRYEKLLNILPNTAGFVLTFHECNYKIFRNSEVYSKKSVPERIYLLTMLIYDIAKKHNKQLILRNFFYEPKEMDYFAEAINRLPDDLIVMSKTTFHEFDPFYPPDAMHGNVGSKRQLIEIDLGVEKAWSSQGIYAQVEYIQRYVKRAKKLNLAGMLGRMRLLWDYPFEDLHEINLYAFSRFMENPDLTVEEVASDWGKQRYPEPAIPYIVSAINRTQYINHHGRYHLGFWLTKSIGEQWASYRYYFGHLLQRSQYKWTQDPKDKELESKLYFPDMETYNQLVDEKDEVIRQVQLSMEDIALAGRYLTLDQLKSWQDGFNFLLDAALLSKEWTRAYFAQRLYMQNPKPQYKMIVDDALSKLAKMDKESGITFGLNTDTGHRYNIDQFIAEMQWRMSNRSRAIDEDEKILESIRKKMNVDQN
jgi:hypothetical protein